MFFVGTNKTISRRQKQRLSDKKEINFKRKNGVGFIVQKNIKEMVL
jgi:hypothetical protein